MKVRKCHGCSKWPAAYDTACRKAASQVESTVRYDRHDAFQVAAERLWNDCPDPDDPRLCYVVARRGIIDWLRVIGDVRRGGKSLKLATVDDGNVTAWENDAPTTITPDHADAVVAKVEHEQRMRWLWKWIPHLPHRQQQVVRLYLDGHPTHEIAHMLDLRDGTVHAHLHHARKKLREVG